jgi:hypothetical protein
MSDDDVTVFPPTRIFPPWILVFKTTSSVKCTGFHALPAGPKDGLYIRVENNFLDQ